MFFGNLLGIGSQGVRATATAQIVTGSQTDCLKPWAILDRWDEFDAPAANPTIQVQIPISPTPRRSTVLGRERQAPPQENDLYVPPGQRDQEPGFDYQRTKVDVLPSRSTTARTDFVWLVPSDPSPPPRRADWRQCLPRQHRDLRWLAERLSHRRRPCARPTSQRRMPPIGRRRGATPSNPETWSVRRDRVSTHLIARDPRRLRGAGPHRWQHLQSGNFQPQGRADRGVRHRHLSCQPTQTARTASSKLVNIYGFFIEGMGDVNADGTMTCATAGSPSSAGS